MKVFECPCQGADPDARFFDGGVSPLLECWCWWGLCSQVGAGDAELLSARRALRLAAPAFVRALRTGVEFDRDPARVDDASALVGCLRQLAVDRSAFGELLLSAELNRCAEEVAAGAAAVVSVEVSVELGALVSQLLGSVELEVGCCLEWEPVRGDGPCRLRDGLVELLVASASGVFVVAEPAFTGRR